MKRKLIRDKVKDLLINKTPCGTKVFANRISKWREENMPCISIYTLEEDAEIHTVSPRTYKRTLSLAIEVVALSDNAIDDFMDSIAEKIENELHKTWNLEGAAENIIYTGSKIGIAHEGDRPFSCLRMVYDVEYLSTHAVPLNDLDDLTQINNTFKVGENEVGSNQSLEPFSEVAIG